MAFSTLTIGPKTFNSIGNSLYRLSTVVFGGLDNDVKLTRGVKNKNGVTTASITRRVMGEFTEGDSTVRRVMSITVNMTVPEGFSADEAVASINDINTWSTASNLTRLFMGES
jgi:hypothetical protein